MPVAPTKKSSIASVAIGIFGIVLILTNCVAVTKTIIAGIQVFREVARTGGDPSQAAGVIGETLIRIASIGLIAILPSILLYVALVPMRLRARWFYWWMFLSCMYVLCLFPFGTIFGIVLSVALWRRRGEFLESVSPD